MGAFPIQSSVQNSPVLKCIKSDRLFAIETLKKIKKNTSLQNELCFLFRNHKWFVFVNLFNMYLRAMKQSKLFNVSIYFSINLSSLAFFSKL